MKINAPAIGKELSKEEFKNPKHVGVPSVIIPTRHQQIFLKDYSDELLHTFVLLAAVAVPIASSLSFRSHTMTVKSLSRPQLAAMPPSTDQRCKLKHNQDANNMDRHGIEQH
jgi:hypothetical protein